MALVEERSISLGPWGGSGGADWSFKAIRGVKGIIINQGGCIVSISFLDASGQQSPKFGGNDPNDLGQETTINFQWPSEYLKSISGSYGAYRGVVVITSLSFHTNFTSYGPFGNTSGGTEFFVPIQDSIIVGFHGASGYYLDSLGIDVRPALVEERSISLGPWGGSGGGDWSFKAISGVKGIIISQGGCIFSIAFLDANGQQSPTFGGNDPNDVGQETTINFQWPSEYLKSITGSYGAYGGVVVITSLSFHTNFTSYGPFGNISGGTEFFVPMQDSIIVGFHGTSGYYLDSLGIDVKPAFVEKRSISLGPWGGSGGGEWSFKAISGVKGIIISQGGCIFSITFLDASGQQTPKFGGNDPNDFGQDTTINFQWPSEYLKSISGSYGAYKGIVVIKSLSFHTNFTSYGPFGNISGGTEFSVPMQDSVIVGFHGASGYFLDSLGIDVKPALVEERSISLGPWGGSGGGDWSFKAISGVKGIIISQGGCIFSISFLDASGQQSPKFGGNDPNDFGQETTINFQWPLEYLKSITGSYGAYGGVVVITSLSFHTNFTSYGPFGNISGGTEFSVPMQDSVIVGFHGASGYYLDSLGIDVKPAFAEKRSISLGPWGGSGGGEWSFKAIIGVKGIIISEGGCIFSISFLDASGQQTPKFGGNDPNDFGQDTTINFQWPSEYLKSISGSYGVYRGIVVIKSLSFHTNFTSYGPYGNISGGTEFFVPIQDSVIVGFHGASGYYLDSLGIDVKPALVEERSISLGPWGGSGGDDWSFKPISGVKGIIISQGGCIFSISFLDASGQQSPKFGGNDPNDFGQETTINFEWPSEYLTSISGSYGAYKGLVVIRSLSFHTNLTSYGPFGNISGGTPFSVPIEGNVIVGFHGRAGYYLDAIGFYAKPLNENQ